MSAFWMVGAFDPGSDQYSIALFFSCLLAYMIPCFHYIIEKSLDAVGDLKPLMGLSEQEFVALRQSIQAKSKRLILIWLSIGGGAGLVHTYFIYSAEGDLSNFLRMFDQLDLATNLATLFIWCLMMTIMSVLIDNALKFSRIGKKEVKVDLLNQQNLTPLARVAVISTLAIIGALAIFPLMFLQVEVNLLAMIPGMIALSIPMFWIFFLPIWPVHKRIKAAKHKELQSVQAQIDELRTETQVDRQLMASLQPMLLYRSEIKHVSEWPFDSMAIARLMLYLIIPPLTWVGAALIEILVDSLL
jgi:hypothetical protein